MVRASYCFPQVFLGGGRGKGQRFGRGASAASFAKDGTNCRRADARRGCRSTRLRVRRLRLRAGFLTVACHAVGGSRADCARAPPSLPVSLPGTQPHAMQDGRRSATHFWLPPSASPSIHPA
eukprot:365042-Chlamydomonas_euryale.AAC.17